MKSFSWPQRATGPARFPAPGAAFASSFLEKGFRKTSMMSLCVELQPPAATLPGKSEKRGAISFVTAPVAAFIAGTVVLDPMLLPSALIATTCDSLASKRVGATRNR